MGNVNKYTISVIVFLILFLSSILFTTTLIFADDTPTKYDVAYIYRTSSRIDRNIIDIFSEIGLSTELIDQKNLPVDYSKYKLIFIGDEELRTDVPFTDYPSIIASYYSGQESGFTDTEGVSKIASTMPLKVTFNGNQVPVYTSGRDTNGVAIPYYFLDNANKAAGLIKYAGTGFTSSGKDFGDVISLAKSGTNLNNGITTNADVCFFGIIKSDYWNENAKKMFLDCVKFVYDYTYVKPIEPEENDTEIITCNKDLDCEINNIFEPYFCNNNNVSQNYTTATCINPGTTLSSCEIQELTKVITSCDYCSNGECYVVNCNSDLDCDDELIFTEDTCILPGTTNSICKNDFVADIELITVVATPALESVTLTFNHITTNLTGIKGILISKDRLNWTELPINQSSYLIDNLKPSTEYTFYIQIIDFFDLIVQDINITVKTLSPPVIETVVVSGGGGGGGGSCKTEWVCSNWSECVDDSQDRTCTFPTGHCKPVLDKPAETQDCITPEKPKFILQSYQIKESDSTENIEESQTPEKEPTEENNNLITGAAIFPDELSDWLKQNKWMLLFAWILIIVILIISFYYLK